MTTQISHFIDGQRTAGQSTRSADVFDPNTGQIQAKVPMAGKSDIDAAVASAVEAQKGWAAWNPQRRARVLMRFIELVNDTIDELAELLSREHGKTLADARGDVQRGIEVIEFCLGIPHLLKGWPRSSGCPHNRCSTSSPARPAIAGRCTPIARCRARCPPHRPTTTSSPGFRPR